VPNCPTVPLFCYPYPKDKGHSTWASQMPGTCSDSGHLTRNRFPCHPVARMRAS